MQKYPSPFDIDAFKAVSASHNRIYDYSGLVGADAFIIACGSLSGFSGGVDQEFLSRFANYPCMILQERVEIDSPKKAYIVVDNYHSFSQCIDHLIVTHHFRKIALVSGPAGHADARERLRAYRDCMPSLSCIITGYSYRRLFASFQGPTNPSPGSTIRLHGQVTPSSSLMAIVTGQR